MFPPILQFRGEMPNRFGLCGGMRRKDHGRGGDRRQQTADKKKHGYAGEREQVLLS